MDATTRKTGKNEKRSKEKGNSSGTNRRSLADELFGPNETSPPPATYFSSLIPPASVEYQKSLRYRQACDADYKYENPGESNKNGSADDEYSGQNRAELSPGASQYSSSIFYGGRIYYPEAAKNCNKKKDGGYGYDQNGNTSQPETGDWWRGSGYY